jgi:hypothetical protein
MPAEWNGGEYKHERLMMDFNCAADDNYYAEKI